MQKKTYLNYLVATLLLVLVAMPGGLAKAVSPTPSGSTSPKATTAAVSDTDVATAKKNADSALAAYKAAKTADKLAKAKALGDKYIDARVASLNNFISKLDSSVSTTTTGSLKTSAQNDIATLATLKTKIDADTTLDQVKTDIKSVFTVKVYEVEMPKFHLSKVIDQASVLLTSLNALTAKIQTRLDTLTAAGKDVTALTTALTDYKAKLTDATTQLNAAKAEQAKMSPTNVDASKAAFTAAKADLKNLQTDLKAARGDLKTLRDGLKAATSASPASSSTASSSPSASVSPSATTTP